MKLSLCITTYNRPELTIEAFEKVYSDPRIDEIVIVDDRSSEGNWNVLKGFCWRLIEQNKSTFNKISLHRNLENIGMSRNKARALELAKNDWCILFDSDNVLDVDYLDAFYQYITLPDGVCPLMHPDNDFNVIFCPDFAKPDFNYKKYSPPNSLGVFGLKDAKQLIAQDSFNCLMNTCNYIVNRKFYLQIYKHNPEHVASDTIWHNYNHLKAGGIFAVVPSMQYYHRVHKESGFMQNVDYNIKQAEKVRKLISELCL